LKPHVIFAALLVCLGLAAATSAQVIAEASADQGGSSSNQEMSGHPHGSMPGMNMPSAGEPLPSPHENSGTAWQPASVPSYAWMMTSGGWMLMAHGQVFLTYNQQGGSRGEGKLESMNWLMTMEQHSLWHGTLLLRQMFSAEALTAPHPGFPELFQTGETYHGAPLVDHQHPHNVFGELAALYTVPINEKVSWLLYGGPVGEPALGPITFMHRASASENPAAPLSHHLQDSTHISFGVVTTGFVLWRFKVEGSAFNGREPGEDRWQINLAALDSWSVRGSVAPTRNWTAQYSYGHLVQPEATEPGDQTRQTASISYNRPFSRGNWANTFVWGRRHKELTGTTQNSYLLESTLNFLSRNYAYTRLELVDKDELFPELPESPSFRTGAYTFGGVRDLWQASAFQLGLGADVTFYSKPAVLDPVYGSNPVSFRVFLRLRPALNQHGH
jgi:hypothetical protein